MFEDTPQEFIVASRQELWQEGLKYLSRGLGQISPDGGYSEGVYYGNFVLSYLAPLSVYFKNLAGVNLFRHPYLERMVNWVIANDKGSGQYSSFDDAYQIDFLILPLIITDSRLNNNWYSYWNSLPPLQRVKPNLIEALSVFEVSHNLQSTSESAVQFFPESGDGGV